MSRSLHRGAWELGIVVGLGITGACVPSGNYVLAQLRHDNTLGAESSFVTPQNPLTDRIDGGARRGANLFHSFLEFNVDEGRGVYFSNPSGIENILSRVTGDKPSQIFGRLGVLGDANLFVLNPKGIVFGRNASLDIKGSFLATTANAIKLGEHGYFSAAEPQNSQLLSVTPGVLFLNAVANQSAAITNRGNLATGHNLTLAAGNLNLEGQLHAGKNLTLNSGGSITLKGIVDASPILDSDTYLGNGGDVTLLANGDITLAPGSAITSFGLLGGNITLKSNGAISATGGIITSSSMTNIPGTTGGDINVIASSLSLTNGAQLGAGTVGSGNGGNLNITTRSLSVTNGAQLGAATLGTGNAGSVNIQASDSLSFDGVGSNGNSSSAIVGSGAQGNGGDIKLTTRSLSVTNGAQLGAGTSGKGHAGNVTIQASDSLSFDGVGSNGNSSGAVVGSLGEGDAGEINITTRSLSVTNGAQLLAGTSETGNAGSVTIRATDSVSVRNDSAVGANSEGAGNPGDVRITTGRLNVTDRSRVSVSNLESATGGELDITAGSILLNNQGQLTAETNSGEGGNIRLKVPDLLLMHRNSSISTEARGAGNSGNININTKFLVAIPSENSDIIASAARGGNIDIKAEGIFGTQFRESLTPESDITATGTVTLNTPEVDIQSRLNQLNANFVNPEQAIASSCLARRNKLAGSFTVTGTGGLPLNPYETLSSQYPVTTVQGIPTEARQQASSPIPNSPYPIANHWKLGDPVQEAQGIMVTADGRIIAGTAPQLVAAAKAQELVCN